MNFRPSPEPRRYAGQLFDAMGGWLNDTLPRQSGNSNRGVRENEGRAVGVGQGAPS